MKARVLKIAGAVVTAPVLAFFGAYFASGPSVAELDERIHRQIEAERTRAAAASRPVLRGPAVAANAADAYRDAIAELHADRESWYFLFEKADADPLVAALAAPATAPLLPRLRLYIDAHHVDIDAVRTAAARAERCDFMLPYERGVDESSRRYEWMKVVVRILAVEGRERAREGDPRAAADCWLDGLRVALDFGSASNTRLRLIACELAGEAAAELERLLESGGVPPDTRALIEREVAAAAAAMPPPALAIRGDRLWTLAELARIGRGSDSVLVYDNPDQEIRQRALPDKVLWNRFVGRICAAASWRKCDRILRDAEAAIGGPGDLEARRAKLSALAAESRSSGNAIVRAQGANDCYVHLAEEDDDLRRRLETLRARAAGAVPGPASPP